MNLIRFFSTATPSTATSLLAQLRKKTGFTLSNCRKALEVCNNDLAKAEDWLQTEANRLGWEKAMKVQARPASEGLIAIARTNNKICIVEVNCETDFVARNEKFASLAQVVANACLKHNTLQPETNLKTVVSQEQLANLSTPTREKLSDYVAQRIGEFGENIILRRGLIYEAYKGVNIDIAVHPPNTEGQPVLTGKYGAFVAYKKIENCTPENESDSKNLGINLCKHIIGSNPQKIGEMGVVPHKPICEDENSTADIEVEEDGLLMQKYLLDPSITVGELLDDSGIILVDFGRFECGEDFQSNQNEKHENLKDIRASF